MTLRKDQLYIAYGSNLNLEQMKHRCPTAEVVNITVLRNWRLWFRGGNRSAVATIERAKGFVVPVLIWRLQPKDELALDHYEGYPNFYRKERFRITLDGQRVYAMIYLMNRLGRSYGEPSAYYFNAIYQGYKSAGFDLSILHQAFRDSAKEAGHD